VIKPLTSGIQFAGGMGSIPLEKRAFTPANAGICTTCEPMKVITPVSTTHQETWKRLTTTNARKMGRPIITMREST